MDASAGKNRKDRKDKEIDRNFTRKLKEDEEEEDVAESGRLFIRNLPYTCTEEEIKDLFSKYGELNNFFINVYTAAQALTCTNIFTLVPVYYNSSIITGPLSEVLFPIDNLTKRPKGFAFIMYMIPENAVTALAQLDGHIFQVWLMFETYSIHCRICTVWLVDLVMQTELGVQID